MIFVNRMIVINKYLVPKGYIGITLYPFVLLKDEQLRRYTTLITHESIHLQQQLELLVIPFYLLYVSEFLLKLLYYKNWTTAYKNISFEREAFANEKDLNYLKLRPFWSFMKFY